MKRIVLVLFAAFVLASVSAPVASAKRVGYIQTTQPATVTRIVHLPPGHVRLSVQMVGPAHEMSTTSFGALLKDGRLVVLARQCEDHRVACRSATLVAGTYTLLLRTTGGGGAAWLTLIKVPRVPKLMAPQM